MGSYFSLHDAAFWEQTILEAPEPSIWSNVRHSPLALHQRLMLERPGRLYYSHVSGLRQGGSSLMVADCSEVSLLVGFEEAAGRLYSAVVLRAPESNPHRYGREMQEVVLTHPAARKEQPTSPASPTSGGGSPTGTIAQRVGKMEMEKLNEEIPLQHSEWQFLLMYAVKEGVLLFFTHDVAECEEIVREIALSFGQHGPTPQDLTSSGGRAKSTGIGSGTAAGANLAAALKVKCVYHPLGVAPVAATRVLTEALTQDLQRQFAVKCEAEDQPGCTNCAVFCLRITMALQLAVRGYDLKRVCESPEYQNMLGPKAGEAACEAWETLWRRVRA